MAVTAIYMIIFAWACFIINKTRKIPVLYLSNKSVFTKWFKNGQFVAIFGTFWAPIIPPLQGQWVQAGAEKALFDTS